MSQKNSNDIQCKIDMRKRYLEYSYQNYKILQCDNQKIQFDYLKLYITLSTIVMTAIATALIYFNIIVSYKQIPFPRCWSDFFIILFMFLSFTTSLWLFIESVFQMKGKSPYSFPFSCLQLAIDWMQNEDKKRTDEEKEILEIDQLDGMLNELAKSLDVIVKDAEQVGKKLRKLNKLLVFSVFSGILGLVIVLTANNKTIEVVMPEENTVQQEVKEATQPPNTTRDIQTKSDKSEKSSNNE